MTQTPSVCATRVRTWLQVGPLCGGTGPLDKSAAAGDAAAPTARSCRRRLQGPVAPIATEMSAVVEPARRFIPDSGCPAQPRRSRRGRTWRIRFRCSRRGHRSSNCRRRSPNAFAARQLLAEPAPAHRQTFAYLVPALLSGLKTIISTGTRALQDQLYHRDLPRVRDALGIGVKTALLKGRANYLCKYRLEQAKGEPRFASREQIAQFQRIVAWGGRTRMGDLAEIEALPEDSPLLPMVTSTAENCLGSECPFGAIVSSCRSASARRTADIVVVNHHLLLAISLKQEGFGEILPGAQASSSTKAQPLPDIGCAVLRRRPERTAADRTGARCAERMQGRTGLAGVAAATRPHA